MGALKKVIKEEKQPALDHVPTDTLTLWTVSVPADKDLEEKLEKLNLKGKRPLQPLMKLSSLFADQPVDDHLNIVVKAPPTGECRTLSTFVTLHEFTRCSSELGL